MDIATFFGIIVGLGLVIGAIFLGGAVDVFVNVPGMMIVFGGTLAATCINFPVEDVFKAFLAVFQIFKSRKVRPIDVVKTMVRVAEISRREGLVALEKIETDNAVLKKACQLIADNADHELIAQTLKIEIIAMRKRHAIVQDVFKKMAAFAPGFGMIGTLIGLVQMLTRLEDPKAIGPAMAVAILTTFYGAFLSTFCFWPIAGKLKSRSDQEVLHLQIIFEGAKAILENNNPRFVSDMLASFLPPSERG
ncbi:motility protein A [Desulfovulcanus sp.]